jgi:hypothetical protein
MRNDPVVTGLVTRARNGQEQAWDTLVERYAPLIWSICRRQRLGGFRLEPTPAGTRLSTETRILATDPRSRRSFAAYWFLIRASSAAIRREVLRSSRAAPSRTRARTHNDERPV